MVNKRLCYKTQEEFRGVAQQIMELVGSVDERLLGWMGPPCALSNRCMMEAENEQQHREGKLTGQQNTDHCCPIYLERYKK